MYILSFSIRVTHGRRTNEIFVLYLKGTSFVIFMYQRQAEVLKSGNRNEPEIMKFDGSGRRYSNNEKGIGGHWRFET